MRLTESTSVKGSIADNFSINANRDIEILGEFGIGSVKEVYSRDGNIYIRGGIAGKNKATIRCTRDLYTKFVSDATIICDGTVHVGFYCMNSDITAKQLIVDSTKGQILGGNIQVEYKAEAAFIGNAGEKRSVVNVSGFDKKQLKENYDKLLELLEKTRHKLAKVKQEMSIYSYSNDLSEKLHKQQEIVTQNYFDIKDQIKLIEYQIRTIAQYLKVKGEGEINVMKRIYPNTCIQIKKGIMEIKKEAISPSFYFHEGQITVK
jgi:uncharacterized protein (DUF342 family)